MVFFSLLQPALFSLIQQKEDNSGCKFVFILRIKKFLEAGNSLKTQIKTHHKEFKDCNKSLSLCEETN